MVEEISAYCNGNAHTLTTKTASLESSLLKKSKAKKWLGSKKRNERAN